MRNKTFLIFESYHNKFGGNQRYIRLLFEHARRGDWQPILLCPGDGWLANEIRSVGGEVHVLPQPRCLDRYEGHFNRAGLAVRAWAALALLYYNIRAVALLRRIGPAVVQCHNVRSLFMVGLATRLLGIPTVLFIKAIISNPLIDRLGFLLATRAPFITAALKPAGLERWFSRRPDKFPVLPIGVDLAHVAAAERGRISGQTESSEAAPPTIDFAFAGWLMPEKGVDVLVDAMAEVVSVHAECRLHLIGGMDDPAMADDLRRRAERGGIADAVQILGHRPDVLDLLARADVYVLPSLSEGVPRSIVEAMALGKPVIASRVGGIPELLRNGEIGVLVEPGDRNGLAAAMIALADDAPRRRLMGRRAREEAYARYSFGAHLDALGAIHDGLITDRTAAAAQPV